MAGNGANGGAPAVIGKAYPIEDHSFDVVVASNLFGDILSDLAAALTALGARGVTRLLVEGGARLAAGLLKARLIDRLAWFHAPVLIGGDGIAAIGTLGLRTLAEAPAFERTSTETVGPDLLTTFRTRNSQSSARSCR